MNSKNDQTIIMRNFPSMLILASITFCYGASKKGSNTDTGPCTIGTGKNSKQLKCTKTSHFEVTQCLSDYCVCVDPRTGAEASGTKTASKSMPPVCGLCHLEVAKSIANTSTNLPQCQPDSGKFQSKQCHGDDNCRCVNEETGAVVGPSGSNSALSCAGSDERIAASLDLKPVSVSSDSKKSVEQANTPETRNAPVGDPVCKLVKDAGSACGNGKAAGVQWYFDVDTFECLAFNYKGCGGNNNRFTSQSECWRRCKLADFGGCAGLRKSAKNAKGENIICYQHGMEVEKCPAGYRCTMLAFFGICCHEATQDLYNRNYRPTCPKGKPIEFENGGVPTVLLGKSCQDYFCPARFTCRKSEIFAYCCPNKTN